MGTRTVEVPDRSEVSASPADSELNSSRHLAERARNGTLGWAGPVTVLVGRSLLIIAARAVFRMLKL